MSEKISEYATSVTALASGDLMDVSKLISTSPDVYQSQKLNYSLLLTELNADLTINNLGNSDLTSTTNARYFKLNGDATTNLLRVQNNSNQNIVQFRGDRSILIDGYTTNGFVKTSAGTGLITVSSQVNTTEGGTGRSAWTANALPYISATNTFNEILAGTNGHVLTMVAGVPSWAAVSAPNLGSANLTSTDNNRTFSLNGNTAGSSFAFLTLAGLEILKVKGDLSVSTYNNGGYIVNKFLNKGAIIGGNGNNGSTTADPNNVLGGSYANGVIIGGYNNTHNGYFGLIGGGHGNTIAADKPNCIALGAGNNITSDYGMALSTVATVSGNFAAVIGGFQNTASGEGAVAVGGNQAIASGYRSFAQGYGSYASAHYAVTFGSNSAASARSARAVGEFCVASGVSSWVSGLGADYGGTNKELRASGVVSFNHSYNDGLVASRAAEGDYSVILGGKNHWTKSGSTSSVILGGEGNTINTNVLRSVILGGSSITATANDTVYGVNFEASTLVTTPQVINTPFTVTVASNAGTITRAYRINKFTNSSAATMTITMSTTAALDGDMVQVRIYDFSASAQTITWVNTENSTITVPTTSNGSTTLPLTVGFQYNSATSKWRCIGSV